MILTAGELGVLRRDLESTLPDTCTINRVTRTPNDSGGWSATVAEVTTVACRVSPAGVREVQIAQAMDAVADHVVTLPAETDVQQSDTITCNGHTFSVSGVRTRVSEPLILRVFVSEDVG